MPCIYLRQLNFPECYENLLELVTERKAHDQNSLFARVVTGKNRMQTCSLLLLEDIVETVCY